MGKNSTLKYTILMFLQQIMVICKCDKEFYVDLWKLKSRFTAKLVGCKPKKKKLLFNTFLILPIG